MLSASCMQAPAADGAGNMMLHVQEAAAACMMPLLVLTQLLLGAPCTPAVTETKSTLLYVSESVARHV